jgi:hypothetical protein
VCGFALQGYNEPCNIDIFCSSGICIDDTGNPCDTTNMKFCGCCNCDEKWDSSVRKCTHVEWTVTISRGDGVDEKLQKAIDDFDKLCNSKNESINTEDTGTKETEPMVEQLPDICLNLSYEHYFSSMNISYNYTDSESEGARIYLNSKSANSFGLYAFGHIAVGIEDPDNAGYEIMFENGGIGDNITWFNIGTFKVTTKDETVRYFLSFSRKYDATTGNYSKRIRNDDGDIILPSGYEEYIQIDQNKLADIIMIQKGRSLNSKPWKYDAAGHSSLDYAIEIVESAGYSVNRVNKIISFFPTIIFKHNINNILISHDKYIFYFDDCLMTMKSN